MEIFTAKTSAVAKLPTGYGKTRTAVCSYLTLRARGVANRMLYIVPRKAQASQAAEDAPRDMLDWGGVKTKSWEVGVSPIQAISAHRRGEAEVFIVTVQSLVSSPRATDAIADLMGTGRWFVVVDEHHHYGIAEDAVWTQRVSSLPFAARLAMSATPDRSDGDSVFGKPDVVVKYRQAWREKPSAVKGLSLHSYDYRIDAVTISGDVVSFTTSELFDEAGGDDPESVDRFVATRQIKWSPKYISPLVLFPVERLVESKSNGIRTQMLIQAMSCSHARMVCEQVQALVPPGMRVEWVGTGPNGRTDDENRAALTGFCPPRGSDGKRRWTIDVLINVGMAGEGLDSTDVAEIVFLTSPRKNNTTLQTIGRGARVIRSHPRVECVVNVDSASEISPMVGHRIMDVFDGQQDPHVETDEEIQSRECGEPPPLPDEPSIEIQNVDLVEIRKDPMFIDALNKAEASKEFRGMDAEARERFVFSCFKQYQDQRDSRFNQTSLAGQWRDKCTSAVYTIMGRILRSEASGGRMVEKSRKSDLAKQINGRAKRHFGAIDTADIDTLKLRYKWLADLDRAVVAGERPSWLR